MSKSIAKMTIVIANKSDVFGPFFEDSNEVRLFVDIFKAGMKHARKLDSKPKKTKKH